jgi:hypothetical protein
LPEAEVLPRAAVETQTYALLYLSRVRRGQAASPNVSAE